MSDIYMTTLSGVKFDLIDPTEEMVVWDDVAHHLATSTRFCGGLPIPYSIAQHSMLVHHILMKQGCSEKTCILGLLHDSEEYVWGDQITPVSKAIDELLPGARAVMSEMKDNIRRTICRKAGITDDEYDRSMPDVHVADMAAYHIERRDMSGVVIDTHAESGMVPDFPPGVSVNEVMDWVTAKRFFLGHLVEYNINTQLAKVA